ncbi:MAG TPA: hypothetical protein ENN43_05430 [bacterium]|nr:hypothetical protein [bacterium]
MAHALKNEAEAGEYFTKAAKTCKPSGIVLYHNQRRTVISILKEAAEKNNRLFIEKDLSLLQEEGIGTSRFENRVPPWLEAVFSGENKNGSVIYLREFHLAVDRVKNDAMNLLINMQVEGLEFPQGTLVVLGVLDTDDVTSVIRKAHSVTFYRSVE